MVKLGKIVNSQKKGSNSITWFQQKIIFLKKYLLIFTKNCRPYLAAKYWIVYGAAFGLGFYLWGPAQGFTKLKNWRPFDNNKPGPTMTIDALQREIELLKKEIRAPKTETQKSTIQFNPESFSLPALGEIIKGFEWINTSNTWRLHNGIDLGLPEGENVMASAEGVVKEVTETLGEGLTVTLEHGNGWESVYANLDKVNLKKGEWVIKGTIIGTCKENCCNSGKPGFHFGINHNLQPVNPEKIIAGLKK